MAKVEPMPSSREDHRKCFPLGSPASSDLRFCSRPDRQPALATHQPKYGLLFVYLYITRRNSAPTPHPRGAGRPLSLL